MEHISEERMESAEDQETKYLAEEKDFFNQTSRKESSSIQRKTVEESSSVKESVAYSESIMESQVEQKMEAMTIQQTSQQVCGLGVCSSNANLLNFIAICSQK